MVKPGVILLLLTPMFPMLGDIEPLPIKELIKIALPPILYHGILD